MIKIWLSDRANWIDYIIRTNGNHVEIVQDLTQIKSESDSKNVVVDMMQSNSSCTIEEILEYNKIFDRIVLINCETRSDLMQMVQRFDLAKVRFINLSHLNYTPHSMKITGVETFFGEVRKLYHNTNYESLNNLKPLVSKNLYFDALLGMPKKHRDFVHQKMQNYGADKFFIRYQRPGQTLDDSLKNNNWHWPAGALIKSETDQKNWYSGNQIKFADMTTNISNIVPVDIYNDTCYSIVTESFFLSDFVMLTEKTAKPLIAKRLFVMFAGPGYLAHLHRLGFRTFDSVIDESYDLELDAETRWTRAFDQVEYLCNQPQELILQKIQPILEHNYNLFVDRDWNQEYEQAIATAVTDF